MAEEGSRGRRDDHDHHRVGVDDVVTEFEEDSTALEIDGGVVVVEFDNCQGSRAEVLEWLSRNGNGRVVPAREVLDQTGFGDDPEVLVALEGLSFTDWRHRDAKGITAVVRFTVGDPRGRCPDGDPGAGRWLGSARPARECR